MFRKEPTKLFRFRFVRSANTPVTLKLVFVRLALHTYRSLLDCRSKLLARPGNLIGGNDCWGSYENVVAPVAVRAALHRIDEQSALGRRLGDSSGKIDFNCKRSFRGLIGHKLDRP